MKLIDKDKVVEEIERLKTIYNDNENIHHIAKYNILVDILSFLDNLETKEVDLDESARHYLLHEHISPLNNILHQADLKVEMQYHKDIEDAYKAGFEFCLNAQKGE